MPYRPVHNPRLPPDADIDTPEMVEAALAIERDDEDVAMLAELAQIGMRLALARR